MTAPFLLQPKEFVATPAALARAFDATEAEAYTRWLSTNHYENFQVVSFLLPKRLHQDFFNVYAFCRWADDLGDEIGETAESLRLLSWWRTSLEQAYRGQATHPVFVALQKTIERHELPITPFADLTTAFEHDQVVTTYRNYDELYAYCRNSANPVGRLVLMLCGYRDAERQQLSDYTCTALQLANFWQDVTVDLDKQRIYLPLDEIARHGYTVEELRARRETPAFEALMKDVVNHARRLFYRGLPLIDRVDRRLALDLSLFSRGGLAILDKIEQQQYRVLQRRPAISKVERVAILLRALLRLPIRRAA